MLRSTWLLLIDCRLLDLGVTAIIKAAASSGESNCPFGTQSPEQERSGRKYYAKYKCLQGSYWSFKICNCLFPPRLMGDRLSWSTSSLFEKRRITWFSSTCDMIERQPIQLTPQPTETKEKRGKYIKHSSPSPWMKYGAV